MLREKSSPHVLRLKIAVPYEDSYVHNSLIIPSERSSAPLIVISKNKFSEMNPEPYTQKLESLIRIRHPYISSCIDYATRKEGSDQFRVDAFYERPGESLREFLDYNRKPLDVVSMTHMMYQILLAIAHLNSNHRYHGLINMDSILRVSDSEWKLLLIEYDEDTDLVLQDQLKCHRIFFSPQLHNYISSPSTADRNHSRSKDDLFSLGLILLDVSLAEPIRNLYSERGLNPGKLSSYIARFEEQYKDYPLIVTAVKYMLELHEKNRPETHFLLKNMADYSYICKFLMEASLFRTPSQPTPSIRNIQQTRSFENRGDLAYLAPIEQPTIIQQPNFALIRKDVQYLPAPRISSNGQRYTISNGTSTQPSYSIQPAEAQRRVYSNSATTSMTTRFNTMQSNNIYAPAQTAIPYNYSSYNTQAFVPNPPEVARETYPITQQITPQKYQPIPPVRESAPSRTYSVSHTVKTHANYENATVRIYRDEPRVVRYGISPNQSPTQFVSTQSYASAPAPQAVPSRWENYYSNSPGSAFMRNGHHF